ncbi:uncharacterized protein LOC133493837 isoform X2 [Syngnathoides biaculeatus]|uniref:uncharacterized protein LOC133493837 isoform X2 n=1 Tax=Syngnathoides biaculeatus TaxID=300417 RepID=UPI002ADDB7EC|nr:uncharacterized protein LOC133493837 isoform X2 [Syngnathoides biaculeatus]
MCARTSEKYKEEVCGPKKEEEPQRQLLDAVLNLQPRIVLRRAEICENLREWQQSVSFLIKVEEEREKVQHIKAKEEEFLHMKEEEEERIIQPPSTGVHLKSEDEGQSEERRGAEPPSRNSSSDGDHYEGSQTDDDDDEQVENDMTCPTANQCYKCSQCRKTFASKINFKQHMKRHTRIHFLSRLSSQGSRECWTLSQLSVGRRQGTP